MGVIAMHEVIVKNVSKHDPESLPSNANGLKAELGTSTTVLQSGSSTTVLSKPTSSNRTGTVSSGDASPPNVANVASC